MSDYLVVAPCQFIRDGAAIYLQPDFIAELSEAEGAELGDAVVLLGKPPRAKKAPANPEPKPEPKAEPPKALEPKPESGGHGGD